jgi:hypothetical protein
MKIEPLKPEGGYPESSIVFKINQLVAVYNNTQQDDGVEVLVSALEKAKQFIENGIELGYITMPDKGSLDTALDTLPCIVKALQNFKANGVSK